MLAEVTPGDLSVSFFTNGGAEANENAIKLARMVTGRHKIIARYRSYQRHARRRLAHRRSAPLAHRAGHGGHRARVRPLHLPLPGRDPDPCPVCTGAPHLEEILAYEGAHTVAAIILETVTGTNGIIVPPDGYLQSVREVCDRHGILLILDEVMAGFGRTGKWFACEHWDVVPDILCVAKGINSGYVPLGAMIARGEIVDQVRDKFFPVGSPTRAIRLPAPRRSPRSRRSARRASSRTPPRWGTTSTRRSAACTPASVDRRGARPRLLLGIELVKSRETREMLVPYNASGDAAAPVARIGKAALERGLYLMSHWNVIMVVPPLTVTREEAEEGVAILDDVLSIADEYVV